MSLSDIRRKYKQILQESQEGSSSDEQVDKLYKQMQKKKKGVLQQRDQNKPKPPTKSNDQDVLELRQRVAYLMDALNSKQSERSRMQNMKNQLTQQKRLLERELDNLKRQSAEKEQLQIERQAQMLMIAEEKKKLQLRLADQLLNNEIAQSQHKYFIEEQNKFRQIIEEKDKQLKNAKKSKTKNDLLLSENSRLKHDIQRLSEIMSEDKRKKIFSQGLNVSYMGRNRDDKEWFPHQLITSCQLFLKHQQVAVGNSHFLNELVRFLGGKIDVAKKQLAQKLQKKYQRQVKDTERKMNHSLNLQEVTLINKMRHSLTSHHHVAHIRNSRVSTGSRKPRKTNYTTLTESAVLDKSMMCQSKGTIERFSSSVYKQSEPSNFYMLSELFEEFRRGMENLLKQLPTNTKKIMKLCSWLVESVEEVWRKATRAAPKPSIQI